MKTLVIFRLSLVLLFCAFSVLAHAQQPAAPAQPGYWNVETNLATRDYTTVRFYNGQDQLVYQETLPNLCLDLSRHSGRRRRASQQLTVALQQVLHDPAAGTGTLLAAQLGQNRRAPRSYAAR